MTLQAWIKEKGGSAAVGRLLGLDAPRVRTWVRRGATPRPLIMQRLVKLSKGVLTLDEIINSTCKPVKGK